MATTANPTKNFMANDSTLTPDRAVAAAVRFMVERMAADNPAMLGRLVGAFEADMAS